jgi:hypothetical protein
LRLHRSTGPHLSDFALDKKTSGKVKLFLCQELYLIVT